jgi:hypothetical protein
MAVRRMDDRQDDRTTMLRVTIPKRLLNDVRETKKLCKEHGLVFDIKPDVCLAIEKAVEEARRAVAEGIGSEKPE